MTRRRSSGSSSSCSWRRTPTRPSRLSSISPPPTTRPRSPGRPFLPRLLRRLLLPAALRVLRPPPPCRQAPALQHRCLGGGGRGGRAHRCPDPDPLAAGAHPASGRLGLRPRGLDGLVREEPGRLRVR